MLKDTNSSSDQEPPENLISSKFKALKRQQSSLTKRL